MPDDIPVFPVAGWTIKSVREQGAILLQISFLSHGLQKLEEADPGRNYGLLVKQAEELRDALDRAVQTMKNYEPQAPEGPRH